MSVKNLTTVKPVRVILDKKGRPINVMRGGILDNNKYARKTPMEKHMEAQLGKQDYNPFEPKK
jgi:hypothetical protein